MMFLSKYSKEHGSYYLRAGARIIFMSDEISVAFDHECWTMLKHGIPERVDEWVAKVRRLSPKLARDISVIRGKDFPVDELNKLLTNSTYIETFAKKHGWISPEPSVG